MYINQRSFLLVALFVVFSFSFFLLVCFDHCEMREDGREGRKDGREKGTRRDIGRERVGEGVRNRAQERERKLF